MFFNPETNDEFSNSNGFSLLRDKKAVSNPNIIEGKLSIVLESSLNPN